jgi:hypothetical protein
MNEVVQRAVALSQSFRAAANAVLDEGYARFAAGTLSQPDFNRVFANYLSMVQKAVDVNNAATHQLTEALRPVLDAVEKDTARLVKKLERLNEERDLIAASLKVLVAIGAVALAMLLPSPASAVAAAAALGDAVHTLCEVRK